MPTPRLVLLAAVLTTALACDPEAADVATEDIEERPDISGTYTSALFEVEGCETQGYDLAWMEGTLQITGEATDLAFEFPDGNVLLGQVDEGFAVDAEGTVIPDEVEVDAVFQGIAVLVEEGYEIDGDVAADVIDSTGDSIACTLTGRLEARQTP